MYKTNNNKALLAILTLATLLTACGGSGGGEEESSNSDDPQIFELSDLQGLWKSTSYPNLGGNDYIFIDADEGILYNVDKTDCYSSEASSEINIYHAIDLEQDPNVYLDLDYAVQFTAKLDGDNLLLTDPDDYITYSRISSGLPNTEMCPIDLNRSWRMSQTFSAEDHSDCAETPLSVDYINETISYNLETGVITFASFYGEMVSGLYDTENNEITWTDNASEREESILLNVNFNNNLVGYSESSSDTCNTKGFIVMK